MNRREEVVFDVFPVLAGLPEDSNTRRRSFAPLGMPKVPDNSGDMEVLSNPCLLFSKQS
jgi:hypothetical protein